MVLEWLCVGGDWDGEYMKTRRNIWPFGTNQPLGPRLSYGKRTRAAASSKPGRSISSKAAAKLERETAAERRERTISAPDFERKLKAHYAKGGSLNEFLQANPGARAWVKRMNTSRKALDWYVVKPEYSVGVATRGVPVGTRPTDVNKIVSGPYDSKSEAAFEARKYEFRAQEPGPKLGRHRGNPSAAAADVYEEFHGMPSTEIVEVTKRVHFHEHLAALGKLEALVVLRSGNEHRLVGFKGAKLCCNERKNQLFVEGGDQALDSKDFGFGRSWPHEKNTLGVVTRLEYFTTKKHLGSEGGTAIYFHLPAEPERGRSAGTGPDLIYDAVNESLEFAGGTYEILAEGISR